MNLEIEAYFRSQTDEVRGRLEIVRALVFKHCPFALEKMSYAMPTYFAPKVLIHIGAFKKHIGIFPPMNDAPKEVLEMLAPFQNEKGNAAFPHQAPFPIALIESMIEHRLTKM